MEKTFEFTAVMNDKASQQNVFDAVGAELVQHAP